MSAAADRDPLPDTAGPLPLVAQRYIVKATLEEPHEPAMLAER